MKQRWTFRCYPTEYQQKELSKVFGCCRYVYNWALSERTKAFKDGKRMNYNQSSAALTKLKKDSEHVWLNEVSCVPVQQSLRHLQTAFVNFFEKRTSYPTFKKKSYRQSAEFTRSAFKYNIDNRNLVLSKIGRIKIKWSRILPSYPTTATIIKNPSGRWFVSFVIEAKDRKFPKTKQVVGIDFGVFRFATLSNGEHVPNPKHLAKKDKRLRWAQRQLARKQKGSNRYNRWRKYVAKLHEKVSDSRKDAIEKFTTDVVKRFDLICIEDLHFRGMVKNHSLARSLSDAAIGFATRKLVEKSERYGKKAVKIDRFFPSSKMCHACGCINDKLSFADRVWTCEHCSAVHDRDDNASKNILAVGQTVSVRGAGVRAVRTSVRKAILQ